MARQLTEQLEREVSAEELMKQTKSNGPSKTESWPSSAPASFDTSYVPNTPAPVVTPSPVATPPEVAAPPPASAPAAAYSPESATTVHGADWHPSSPDNKPANE
jgi:hypothetical protein